jgi:hypothetical protein
MKRKHKSRFARVRVVRELLGKDLTAIQDFIRIPLKYSNGYFVLQ